MPPGRSITAPKSFANEELKQSFMHNRYQDSGAGRTCCKCPTSVGEATELPMQS
jgi:hypothetical protein